MHKETSIIHDVFISYRRDGGFEAAKYLYDSLTRDGYSVTFDIDTLRGGRFDDALLSRIDECTDFIIVLNKGCFDRTLDQSCAPADDWVRRELAHALSKNKHIVPIMLTGFNEFPPGLPSDISEITKKNGPRYEQEYIDTFYDKLKGEYLQSAPNAKNPPNIDAEISDNIRRDVEDIKELAHSKMNPVVTWVTQHKKTTIAFLPLAIGALMLNPAGSFGLTCLCFVFPIGTLAYLCSCERKVAIAVYILSVLVSSTLWLYLLPETGPIMAMITVPALSLTAICVTSSNFRIK